VSGGCVGLRLERAEALMGGDFYWRRCLWAEVKGGGLNGRRLECPEAFLSVRRLECPEAVLG
jgi:hypothetical protein